MRPREIDVELQNAVMDAENIKIVRDLLGRKADPNSRNELQQTPLAIAVDRNMVALCRLLLVYQADPRFALPVGVPKHSEAAELVHGWAKADVPTVFSALEELVLDAASVHDASLLGLALATVDIAGGNAEKCVAQRDVSRNSLLHHCADGMGQVFGANGEARARLTARALLGWGVPTNVRNSLDETPLLLALRRMNTIARSNMPSIPLEPACSLLEARADVETVDPQTEETLLMQAARAGNLAACELLLKFKADPLRQNLEGKTAINLSADQPEVVLLLRTTLVRGVSAEFDTNNTSNIAVLEPPPGTGRRSSNSVDTDGAQLAAAGEKTPATTGERTPAARFVLGDVQELCSAEGLLNQMDLEESYDTDWTVDALSPHGDNEPPLESVWP